VSLVYIMSKINHFKILLLCKIMLDGCRHGMILLDTDVDRLGVKRIILSGP
jgi:hypothetical protein